VLYIVNAFSLQMLPPETGRGLLTVERIDSEEASHLLTCREWASAIGHADLAALVSADLEADIKASRQSVTLDHCTELLVAQYRGPRLPEGTTQLPEGATIEYWRVNAVLTRY